MGGEQSVCPRCGRSAGPLRLCNSCWFDQLQSEIDLLTDETAAAGEQDSDGPAETPALRSEPAEGERESAAATPTGARPKRRLLLAGGIAALALGVAALAASQPILAPRTVDGGEGDAGGAATEPASPLIGRWSGEAEVRYEDGTRDRLTQTVDIARLEIGEEAGFSVGVQGRTRCNGPLTLLSVDGATYRFGYRELNTAECVATSRLELTPRGSSRLEYREVTNESVNRGTLVRVAGGTTSTAPEGAT